MDEEGLPDEEVRRFTDPRAIWSYILNDCLSQQKPVLLICIVVWVGLKTVCFVLSTLLWVRRDA